MRHVRQMDDEDPVGQGFDPFCWILTRTQNVPSVDTYTDHGRLPLEVAQKRFKLLVLASRTRRMDADPDVVLHCKPLYALEGFGFDFCCNVLSPDHGCEFESPPVAGR